MSDYSKLKELAAAIHGKGSAVEMLNRWAAFESACKPELITGLIAENEANRHEREVVCANYDQLKAECAGLRELFLSAAHGLCLPVEADAQQVVDAITALQVRNADLRKHAPSSEIIWCECGDGYPANSYGAGFMAANEGVCENCDAANTCGSEQP